MRNLKTSLGMISLLFILLTLFSSPAQADSIGVGFLWLDSIVFAEPGVNTFVVGNLTGPLMDGAPVLPQFPVTTPLTFQNSHLLVQLNNGQTQNIALGNIGPGLFDDPSSLLKFPDTTEFQSATFTATLSQTHLTLLDGHTFDAAPNI